MAKKISKQEIINEFKNYLTLYYNSDQRLPIRTMTMLSKYNCDFCDKTTRKIDDYIHTVEIYHLVGVQCCLNCIEQYGREYYLYIMSLKEKMVPYDIFKKIIQFLKPEIDFNALNIKRTNGNIEIWKLIKSDSYIYDNDTIHIKVVNLENTIQKTNTLKIFCELNQINYNEAFQLFKELYFDVNILSWSDYLDTLTTKNEILQAFQRRYSNKKEFNSYVDMAIAEKDEDAVRLMLKYNIY